MIIRVTLVSIFLFLLGDVQAQLDKYNTTDLHPVSPTAFQFLKYTEMPVSEYTGLPGISVPLYEIDVDEVKIPVQLTYHAQGLRVSEEASWVGLGWDLQMGSIVQTINDRDDYGTDPVFGTNTKLLPDFFPSNGDGSPYILPIFNLDPQAGSQSPGIGWMSPFPINQPQPLQGFAVATNYYIPVNGEFRIQQAGIFAQRWYDSEPDFFVASFMGETVKFILDFNMNNKIRVLNKKGYVVNKTTGGFSIINPKGTTYFFEIKSSIVNATSTAGVTGYGGSTTLGGDTTSHIFLLSKILTKNGKLINFGYSHTGAMNGYMSCNQKMEQLTNGTLGGTHPLPPGFGVYQFTNIDGRVVGNSYLGSGSYTDYSINQEQYYYLQSISFPTGSIQFQVSARTDVDGAQKLDQVQLLDPGGSTVRTWNLDYSYFDASGVTGNGYGYFTPTDNGSYSAATVSNQRLKLLDVRQDDGGVYTFLYNATSLPKKNSFATDYWGFYNGQLTNTTFIPNPAALGLASLGNNGNNKDASLSSNKACILEGIQYPTGGKVQFEYELNEFDKDQVIGFSGATNPVQGSGLRIRTVSHFNSDASLAKRTVYTYSGGKLINRLYIIRQIPYSVWVGVTSSFDVMFYTLNEISSNGVFASCPLSSVHGVGYDMVTRQEVDAGGATLGKIVTQFYNNPDLQNPTIANRALSCGLPSVKSNTVPENGSARSVNYYDNQNTLVRSVVNNYVIFASNIFYGARIFPYGALNYVITLSGTNTFAAMPQNLVGYYPIFDVETLLSSSRDTTYFANGQLGITTINAYDEYNQLSQVSTSRSDGQTDDVNFNYPYSVVATPVITAMLNNNRLSDIVSMQKATGTTTYRYDKTYMQVSDKFVESIASVTQNAFPYNNTPDSVFYELYDPSNANLLQYRTRSIRTSAIWDYNGQYVIAEVKNADYSSIAFSSFEADGKGNWTYTGIPVADVTAPTGARCYNLSAGNITKAGLNTAKSFVVSYWSKNGSATVNGATVSGQVTKRGWTYYEHSLPAGASSVTVSGAVTIDELRLYPSDAQMTTYTYMPLVGMTTSCDVSNRISYYEYDVMRRLKDLKDQDGNIIKTYDYHYQQQP